MNLKTAIPETTTRARLAEIKPLKPVEVVSPILVKTPGMTLRPLSADDREEFIRTIRQSRETLDRWSKLHLDGESDDHFFDRQLELCTRGESTGLAWRRVGVNAEGRIIGAFNLGAISRGLEWKADTNWWVGSEFEGHGLATQGVRAILAYALRDMPEGLGLHNVFAWIRKDNHASIRVAEKLGFEKCADERSYLQTGDEWQLHDCYVRRVA